MILCKKRCRFAAVLLLQAIAAWRGDHTGPPSSSAERRAFKEILQGWRRTIDGVPVEELNFDVRSINTGLVCYVCIFLEARGKSISSATKSRHESLLECRRL